MEKFKKDKLVFKVRGIPEQEYKGIENEILEKNRSSLRMISLCLVAMFAGLLVATFFSETMVSNRIAYVLTGASSLVIWMASPLLIIDRPWRVLWFRGVI